MRPAEEAAVAATALMFLTRLPLPGGPAWTARRMAAAPRWYPAVGLLIGGIAGAAHLVAAAWLTPGLAALSAVAAAVLVTGALHEDGLADTCDGIGGGATGERALEIMRDSRIGAYGALALGLVTAGRVMAVAALPVAAVPLALVAAHAASRASMVGVIATGRYARTTGLGAALAGVSPPALAFALGTGAVALLAVAFVLPAAAVAGGALGLGLAHLAVRRVVGSRIGGYTGDTLGAVQQTGELGLLLGVVACL